MPLSLPNNNNRLNNQTSRYTLNIMIYTKNFFNFIIFFLLAILFLLLDISAFTILQKKIVFSLLCLYVVLLFKKSKMSYLAILSLFMSLETFLLYGQTIYFLFFLILLSIITVKLYTLLHKNYFFPHLFIVSIVAIEQIILEPRLFNISTISPYTIEKICVNLLIVAIFLKYLPKGKQGNRL